MCLCCLHANYIECWSWHNSAFGTLFFVAFLFHTYSCRVSYMCGHSVHAYVNTFAVQKCLLKSGLCSFIWPECLVRENIIKEKQFHFYASLFLFSALYSSTPFLPFSLPKYTQTHTNVPRVKGRCRSFSQSSRASTLRYLWSLTPFNV